MNFLNRLFGQQQQRSSSVAKERLQLVLTHDRVKLSPELMETLKGEIIAVISKHVMIDTDAMEIKLTQSRGRQQLTADIPIIGSRESAPTRRIR
jgi:cell division topological specificity factor